MGNRIVFDHEKLDVYKLELAFIHWVTPLLLDVKRSAEPFHREICEQLDRASLSSLLNTAEGNGKRQGRQRAKFFDDARGSAVESAACLDALVAKGLMTAECIDDGKAMLLRIVGMLTKLVERFDPDVCRPRPSCSSSAAAKDEHEDENEGRGREGGPS